MKYFTPDRYLALQDFLSDAAMDGASGAWEKAAANYRRALRRLLPELPAGLRALAEDYALHEADVLSLGGDDRTFLLVLRPDTPARELLVLHYRLEREAAIDANAFASPQAGGTAQWLYDEIGVVRGAPATFTHAILLSNGWEIELRVREVAVLRAPAFYPGPEAARQPTVSRSA